ncbi:hypothetical protein X797_011267 [Metarhizium robertsii]|uniref:MARVEL domain-containing protein n=2 Tax=Metarhizium robertsii TaxID=568076 RepID=E9FDS9_METRA|nr:uncharacterized protein MAA_10428 [Metarhizium robertsii ARSEF 23]EFY94102.1 hypothetical protein MAA_10428 [Metarhizium robertsii ARSEF 23]EXU95649.1 hypothetical protein X797_011267 [Metarhizium robertsii]
MPKFTSTLQTARQVVDIASAVRGANTKEVARGVGQIALSQGIERGKDVSKTYVNAFEMVPRLVLRGLQLVLALIICGFYGNRLSSESKGGEGIGPVWMYGVAVAGLSAVTAIVFAAAASLGAIPCVGKVLSSFQPYLLWWWDLALFVLWMVTFGIFAGLFLKRKSDDPYRGSNTTAMKIALWIDVANAVLWFCSAGYSAFKQWTEKKADRMAHKLGQKILSSKESSPA